jgi:3-phenylpropionate/cinnamic acid dioxygenase small subunit
VAGPALRLAPPAVRGKNVQMTTLSPQDHEDIRQLLARYNLAIDLGHIANWVDCFTADGVFECLGLPDGAKLGGRHQGPEALRTYAENHFAANKGRARHWNWNLVVEPVGTDRASMTCYLGAFSAGQGRSADLRATGIYRDELVRGERGWRFASRQVTIDPA